MPNARYGYVLTINEDGRVVWSSVNNNGILPSQVGKSGQFLSTDGSTIQWAQQVASSGGSSSLSGLSDVLLATPSSGQFLSYDTSDNKWKNNTLVISSGTATALNTTAVSNNATFYPVLSSGTGGNFAASIDTGLTYNPSTDMLTASGITSNRIVGSTNIIITESTTSRTLQSGDNGGIIHCTNTSGATLTIPTGLPVGFSVGVLAAATGVVSFTTSGTTLNNRQSHTRLAGQWAMGTIIQRTTNNFVLAGDTV